MLKNQKAYDEVLLEFKRRIADDFDNGLTSYQYNSLLKSFFHIVQQFTKDEKRDPNRLLNDLDANRTKQAYEAYLVYLQNLSEMVREQRFSGLRIVRQEAAEG